MLTLGEPGYATNAGRKQRMALGRAASSEAFLRCWPPVPKCFTDIPPFENKFDTCLGIACARSKIALDTPMVFRVS